MMRRVAIPLFLISLASPARADELVGVWKGRWTDERSGHAGPLRGKVRTNRDGDYRATFTGRFWGVVPFWFRTPLEVVGRTDDQTFIAGERRLGPFGRFTYSGVVGASQFQTDYASGRWSGQFTMRRVK